MGQEEQQPRDNRGRFRPWNRKSFIDAESPRARAIRVLVGSGGAGLYVTLATSAYFAAVGGDMITSAVLIFCAFIIGVIAIFLSEEWGAFRNRPKLILNIFLISTLMFASIGLFIWNYQHKPLPVETDIHGWLLPGHSASAKTLCSDAPWGFSASAENPDKMLTVALGASGIVIPFLKEGSDKNVTDFNNAQRTILTVGKCDALTVKRVAGMISVSGDVYDSLGYIVANIKDNEFHLVPSSYGYSERSQDRSNLTVYGKKKEHLLRVDYINLRSLRITGYFSCEGGPVVHVEQDSININHSTIENSCTKSYPGGRGIIVR